MGGGVLQNNLLPPTQRCVVKGVVGAQGPAGKRWLTWLAGACKGVG